MENQDFYQEALKAFDAPIPQPKKEEPEQETAVEVTEPAAPEKQIRGGGYDAVRMPSQMPVMPRTAEKVDRMIFQSVRKLRSRMYFRSSSSHSSKESGFRLGWICQ